MKKISLLLLALSSCLLSWAQDLEFTLKGKTDLPAGTEVRLIRFDLTNGRRDIKAIVDAGGAFSITSSIAEPQLTYVLYFRTKEYDESSACFLEKGVINLHITKAKRFAEVSGTPLNKDLQVYNGMLNHLLDSINAQRHYGEYSKEIKTETLKILQRFVPKHRNSLLAVNKLKHQLTYFPEQARELAALYQTLTTAMQQSNQGKEIALLIKGVSGNKVGDKALDFSLPDTSGKIVQLKDFKGKYVFIDFWATWCGPCMLEMPNVVKAYQQYRNKNLEIIGISLDMPTTKDLWLKTVKEKQMNWVQLSDLRGWNNHAALLYNIQSVPSSFLIDPSGKIIAKNLRGEELQSKLAEILN